MLEKIVQIWKLKDLRNNILFILAMLVIFRFAANIPIPGIDVSALKDLFSEASATNTVVGLLDMFSGGGLMNFSVVMMGVAPYITASIIFQLLVMVIPKLEELSKEGEYGRRKINKYTRWLTVPLAALQGYGMIHILGGSSKVTAAMTSFDMFAAIVTITAGTVFLMWIGELISEKHLGNGISLLIFAGIISRLPYIFGQTTQIFEKTQLFNYALFGSIAIITIVAVVIMTEGQRNIPIHYAKMVRGNRMYGGMTSHLPLRVNTAGVIPIIFAISIIIAPPMIAQFFMNARSEWIVKAAEWTMTFFQNNLVYGILYFVMVFGFTYFYTYVIFHPSQIAENLQKQGAFIPGIRPGRHTADYLQYTINRILFTGALFLSLIAVLPLSIQQITGLATMTIGGTSLLIVVSVVIETVKQVESQLEMREYEGF